MFECDSKTKARAWTEENYQRSAEDFRETDEYRRDLYHCLDYQRDLYHCLDYQRDLYHCLDIHNVIYKFFVYYIVYIDEIFITVLIYTM
jgi:hypothetical protein